MQRIIQISIDFDEEEIKKSIEKNAEKHLVEPSTQKDTKFLIHMLERFMVIPLP